MAKTFNMKNLSNAVAEEFGLTLQTGAEVTRFVFDSIADEIAAGKQVRLHKFGSLVARKRPACLARNPVTGAPIKVPARRVVKLTVSPALKAKL